MSKTEAIEIFAKTVFNEDKKVISTDELNILIAESKSEQERNFYVYVYNYLLQQSQKEIITGGES